MDEVYTKQNIEAHRYQKSNFGSKNGNSRLSENEVLLARKYYVDHTLTETFAKYGSKYTKDGFREVLTRTYSNIPIYKKSKKQWMLNNKIIDINNYKPVSTIFGSEE